MELLEEDLTCPICCCLFEDPRVLPCSHSFCKKCLEGILDGIRGPAWRPPFKCPTCRKETVHNGIASLQVNYSLRGIVEKYNRIRVMPRMSLCRVHSGQPLNIFCATDLKLICGFCATTGDHKGHKFCALAEAYEREKLAFEELFRVVEGWRGEEVQSCLESLEGAKKKALERVSRDADRVSEYFDKLLRTLEHKRREILSDLETLKLAVMQTFDPEINQLRSAIEEQRRALSIAESFRSLSDPLTFLQQMQDFREKLRVVRGTPLPSQTDVDVGLLGLQSFDVKEWDRVLLGEVDKLCAPYESSTYLASQPSAAAPRFSRVLWRVVLVVCACLPALNFLPSDCLALGFQDKVVALSGFSLPGPGEIVRWFGFCWKEAEAICTLLTELCRNCILDLINTTSDFIS
ncbi:tripartite motif-containing 13-like isoform X2 [Sinocyclocheilus anshuiensis]|uniref:Tripartite motif-containing 13-like n=2 Tax=Sinocyclocheilus anshuiensis TaxID=1608454 RepID=A0A671PJQ7_9TELE|nr:PREDICTED: tripartite motif-containing 13-like isoform X2 [Sinocyclocheilus anshuiensis]XP_016298494.1 PREDICTED: tripartite motif-containing 13-like isoform X2 [Sinocyclocheilus anshuiensis]XP_016298496.1 PREDICTED: tripartite motif-containing 13-like isoform X2 [Sinocyclocheilus anshuiensis]XP_016298497.1 PREDICTED: tripartite motif-containing 13-like isoform X2 [Sinocyclocheilus anshuiensis]